MTPYPLDDLHYFINSITRPYQLTGELEEGNDTQRLFEYLEEEMRTFELRLAIQVAGCGSAEAVQVLIRACQAGFHHLLNRVHRFATIQAHAVPRKGLTAALLQNPERVQAILLTGLQCLRGQYASCFDEDCPLPLPCLRRDQELCKERVRAIEKAEAAGSDPALMGIALKQANMFINATPESGYTYRQSAYLLAFTGVLEELLTGKSAHNLSTTVTECMLYWNFNDLFFIRQLFDDLKREISAIEGRHDQVIRWSHYHKEYSQSHHLDTALYNNRPAAKTVLCNMIKKEIAFIRSQIEWHAEGPAPHGNKETTKETVRTSLAVSQVALMSRLLVDSNIIQTNNQSELLKLIAGALSTPKIDKISPDSLRAKYYSPDAAAISIIKDHLHLMLSQLRKY